MKHPIAYVRQLAMARAPDASPASLLPAVAANLSHADADVVVAAAELARRAGYRSLAKEIVRAMPKQTGLRLNIVSVAAHALGARMDRIQMLISLLGDKDRFDEALSELVDLLDYSGRSADGAPGDAERAALVPRWKAFVKLHRDDIEQGRKVPLSDPSVTADLVPRQWKLHRRDGTDWPR
jgi:hypothetical protein